jgi:LPS O-antigen subunit length determinant protein (WzzB/FepE family)
MASTRTEGVIVVLVIVFNAVLSAILMIALLALIWRVGRVTEPQVEADEELDPVNRLRRLRSRSASAPIRESSTSQILRGWQTTATSPNESRSSSSRSG